MSPTARTAACRCSPTTASSSSSTSRRDALFARSVALSPDPEQQFLYVGDGKDIAILDRKSLDLVGTIKCPGMIGGGHLITTDAKGNIYVAATGQGLQRLNFQGMSATASR